AAESFVASVLRVHGHARQHVLVGIALLRRGGQPGLDRLQDHRLGHALLGGHRVDDKQQFLGHSGLLSRDDYFFFLPGFFAGAMPSAAQSGTSRALSMLSIATGNSAPSTSNTIVSPSVRRILPCSLRRPSCGSFRPTLACSPAKRSNCAGVNRGRSTPGDETSSV